MLTDLLPSCGAFLAVALAATCLRAETLEIKSGVSDVWARNNCLFGEFEPAVTIGKHPAWDILPGTAWLHPDGTGEHSTCSVYRLFFDLPEGYRNPRLTISVFVDDWVSVFLNRRELGSGNTFNPPALSFSSTAPSDFRAGRNEILFEAGSGFGAFGIDFSGTVTFDPGDPLEDTDGDRMPDWWETQSRLDPGDPRDATRDPDVDRLVNAEEFRLRTDPRRADSDGDGLDDGDEMDVGTDPSAADSDGDTYPDGEEIKWESDPSDQQSRPRREEIVIRSGVDTVPAGACSSRVLVPAVTVPKIDAWDRIPETEWIHPDPAGTRRNCASYRAGFVLPEAFREAALDMYLFVDGSANVSVNGRPVGSHSGFIHPPSSLEVAETNAFVPGENEILFQFTTDGGADGLDFRAVVTYVPTDLFLRANANGDARVDISDGVCILHHLFRGRCELSCLDAADANDNGTVDISDAVRIFNYLFLDARPPPAPGPWNCGSDPTQDVLDRDCVSLCP